MTPTTSYQVYDRVKPKKDSACLLCNQKKRRWRGTYSEKSFDFLGYTFRLRRSKKRHGQYFIDFTPTVSNAALKAMR